MKHQHVYIWCIAMTVALGRRSRPRVEAQMDPAFTFQGQLKNNGTPVDGRRLSGVHLVGRSVWRTATGGPVLAV